VKRIFKLIPFSFHTKRSRLKGEKGVQKRKIRFRRSLNSVAKHPFISRFSGKGIKMLLLRGFLIHGWVWSLFIFLTYADRRNTIASGKTLILFLVRSENIPQPILRFLLLAAPRRTSPVYTSSSCMQKGKATFFLFFLLSSEITSEIPYRDVLLSYLPDHETDQPLRGKT